MSNFTKLPDEDFDAVATNIDAKIDKNPKWMNQFDTYLSNTLIEYFETNKTINPKDFINKIGEMSEKDLAEIILKNNMPPPEILEEAINEVVPPNKENAPPAYKNGVFVFIIFYLIQSKIEKNGTYVGTMQLIDYLRPHFSKGGKKTQRYKKRKNKRSKTRRTKKYMR